MTEKIIEIPRRGRPAFQPTLAQRQRVERMKFCGDSDNVIARALAIHPDTLRTHFSEELADGHAMRRAELVDLLFEMAKAWKMSAITALLKMGRAPGPDEPPTA